MTGDGITPIAPDYVQRAILYMGTPGSGGSMFDLGLLGGATSGHSYGLAINAAGQVTGESTNTAGASHAFLYSGTPGNGGGMFDLGMLNGATSGSSTGGGINASGQVAGRSTTSQGRDHAFVYTGMPGNGGAMFDLGTLGGTDSYAATINDAGEVVGGSKTATSGNNNHAFLYTGTPGSGGSMHDLGTLGRASSDANAINNAGNTVGSFGPLDDGSRHAFLYVGTPDVDGHMIDLDAWLDATNPTEGAQWRLSYATGISNTGLTVGYGGYAGTNDWQPYLLDASSLMPEPSGLSLIIVAAGRLLTRRRRKHECFRYPLGERRLAVRSAVGLQTPRTW